MQKLRLKVILIDLWIWEKEEVEVFLLAVI